MTTDIKCQYCRSIALPALVSIRHCIMAEVYNWRIAKHARSYEKAINLKCGMFTDIYIIGVHVQNHLSFILAVAIMYKLVIACALNS